MKGAELLKLEKDARKAQQSGDHAAAVESLEQLVTLQPDWEWGSAWYDLSRSYDALNAGEKAINAAAQACTYQPGLDVFELQHADLLSRNGRAEGALDVLLSSVESNCSLVSVETMRGTRSQIAQIFQQILTAPGMDASTARERLASACPTAAQYWKSLL